MKRLRVFAVVAMLAALAAAGVVTVHAGTDDYIKVGIKYGSSAPSSITVSASEGLALYNADGSYISKAGSNGLEGYSSVTLKNNGAGVDVTDSSGNTIITLSGDGTECVASAALFSSNGLVTAGTSSYRGGIVPYINSSGQMNIINYVDIEDYLRSVISKEMSPSYQLEALKAQAVTARSFVLQNEKTHASQGFSVCATTHCQVYGGAANEYDRTDQAVEETAGKIMYYNGAPVAGYYYANSGGHTENSEDVWSAALGYLRGKPDPYSPDNSWTVRLTKQQIYNALSSRGIGDIQSITIDSVNDSGYAASVTVNGSRKSYTVTKDSIRSMFGSAATLKSRNITLDTEGGTIMAGSGGTSTTIPESGSWYAQTSSGKTKLGENISIVSASGTSSVKLNGMNVVGAGGASSVISYTPAQTVVTGGGSGTTITFNSDSDVLIINGKGYGHGVGMSQTGAQEMAKQGFDYIDILKFYYTDIEVK